MKPVMPKTDKDIRKLEANITNAYNAKFLNKISVNQIQQHIKKVLYYDQVDFIPVIQD